MAFSSLCRLLLLTLYGANIHTDAVSPERYAQPALNVALRGIASQSSTNSYLGSARNANDGSLANNYLRSQCSYTKKDHEPHWTVDLQAPHRVMSVAVTNRILDCCKERLFNAEIRIGNDPKGKTNPRCGVISSIESGETLSFSCQGMVGQYVSVSIPGREEHLILCEVQVFGFPVSSQVEATELKESKTPNGAPNVALKGVSQQSSLLNMYGESKNAIDGSLDSNFFYVQCTGTKEETNPWWMVDLKSEFKVYTVAVTNRGDCCEDKINFAQIRVGNSAEDGGIKNPICGIITSIPNGKTVALECDGMVGRYVTVFLPGENRSLSICEVQVFGLPSSASDAEDASKEDFLPDNPDLSFLEDWFKELFGSEEDEREVPPGKEVTEEEEGENLAFRGVASQSSTYDELGAPENAIDGSPNARYMSKHCAHTDLDFQPWWMVDLTKVYNVSKVKILSRMDCCKERMDNAEIRVGNSPVRGGTRNPKCASILFMNPGSEEEFVCGMVGRYITVTIPKRSEYLTLCELKAYGTEVQGDSVDYPDYSELKEDEKPIVEQDPNVAPNVALKGEATMSSTERGNASEAIDGSLDSCTNTEEEENPSLMLNLNSAHKVFSIAVTASQNPKDLDGAEISVFNPSAKGSAIKICGTVSSIGSEETFSFNCHGMVGRYIIIRIPGEGRKLGLCEVQVFGHPVGDEDDSWSGNPELQKKHHGVKNVAPQGIAYQSSHFESRDDAKRAIDGSLASNYLQGQCTHTRRERNPSWMVNLRSSYRIQTVAITNRFDCCRERINGAKIHIGNSQKDLGAGNPVCGTVSRMQYGETLSFNCSGMEGKFVSIIIPNQVQYLTLCEVQIFGEPADQEGALDPQATRTVPTIWNPPPTGAHDSEEASKPTELTGKYFLFPEESDDSYVTLAPSMPLNLKAFTLCMKLAMNFPETRETILFSYRTTYYDELNIWQEEGGKVGFYMSGEGIMFPPLDRSKEWTHFCLTWESKQGRSELWVNGRRTGNGIYRRKHKVRSGGVVILGQDQDSLGHDFDKDQSFVGKIQEVNMWNRVLSLKSLKWVFKGSGKQKGNIFNWSEMSYSKHGNVRIE